MAETRWLSTGEAALIVGVTPSTLRQLVAEGEGPPAHRPRSQLRFREDELLRWLDERRVKQAREARAS